jgi:hypothetical protein
MIFLTMTAAIVGALLGQRFKVFVLVPAIAVCLGTAFGIGMAHPWSVLLAMALGASALQMGYLGGVVIRFVGAGVQARKDPRETMAATQRPPDR